jgi:hypothetical protein
MKRSISEIGHDDDAAGNKKARLADLGSTVVTVSLLFLTNQKLLIFNIISI